MIGWDPNLCMVMLSINNTQISYVMLAIVQSDLPLRLYKKSKLIWLLFHCSLPQYHSFVLSSPVLEPQKHEFCGRTKTPGSS